MNNNNIPIALMNIDEDVDVIDLRIVGGRSVTVIRKYPWMVSLQNNGKHYCGAMLIHPSWLISAKHCSRITKTPDVWIGGLDLDKKEEFITRKVVQIIEHDTLDVILLKLDQPVTDRIPLKVNNNPKVPTDTQTEAIGWGRLTENGALTNVLQEVVLPIVVESKCMDLYGTKYNSEQMLCAGVDTGEKDACQGDSGGPLILTLDNNDPSTQYLIGITSMGIGCGRKGKYGVWINVAYIVPWIIQFIPDFMAYDAINKQSLTNLPPPQQLVENFVNLDDGKNQLSYWEYTLLLYLIIIVTALFMIFFMKRFKYI